MTTRDRGTATTLLRRMMTLLLLILLGGVVKAQLPTDVTGYETVTVTIPASDYDSQGAPQIAPVKYNRQCALVITSDDMGTGEYLNNWALMNGYPLYGDWRLGNDGKVNWGICPRGEDALNAPYNTTYMGARSQDVDDYQPLTFTDDTGKEHRFTATSAIWPASYNDNNYAHMQGDEAQIMIRTGWSFAQHDVNNITGDTDAEKIASIASRFQPLSELWENNVTGIGLKVMVEPNGDKNYIDATAASNEMCWSIFQSADGTHPAISNSVSTWTASLPTSFSNKSNGSTVRTFPNADATKEQNFLTQAESAIAAGSTNPIFYGCHGMGTYPRQLVTDIATNATYKDKVWVTSADEYWEYYNIYHNAIIGTPTWDGSQLTFTVQVPTYKKNQFRELTINIPGLTGGTDCTLTSSDGTVTTGSYAQTNDASKGYVVNFGMETKILDYIDELTALYRNNPTNLFVKRDVQYLIDQLLPGATKTAKQDALDKEYDYSYLATANLQESGVTVATKTLSSGYYDEATDVKYYIPRYILEGTTLYKTTGNGAMTQSSNVISQPWYGNYLNVNAKNMEVAYTYAKEMEDVVFYTEAENISGHSGEVPIHTTNWNSYQGRVEALCSAGSGVRRDNNNFGTITTLEPGTYKVTIGVVASASNDGGYYSIRVGGTDAANEVGNYAGATKDQLTEYTTGEFTVKANKTVTIYHSGSSNVALDYVFIQKTADFEPSDPTVTLSSNVLAAQVNSTVTLRATPVWNGKGALTSLKFQYKTTGGADSEFADIATVNDPVSDTEYTQTFTPTELGTYVFRAVLTDADGTIIKTTDDAATAASAGAVAISVLESVPYDGDYTLHLIDNAGNEVFTQSVTHATVSGGNTDPLADQYRSPFVSSYLYFDSQAEAQANSGTPSFWNQEDIYVGYVVDATKMASDKVHAIWANDRYMHSVQGTSKTGNGGLTYQYHNVYVINNQKWDVTDIGSNTEFSQNEVSISNLPFIDNSYMWKLGTDPYNVVLENKSHSGVIKTQYNKDPTLYDKTEIANANHYCILYWQDKQSNSTVETSASYYLLYDRTTSTSSTLTYNDKGNHYLGCSSDGNYQWRSIDKDHTNYTTFTKLYITELPSVDINIVNADNEVESTIQGYFKSGASMPSFTPFYLYRAYTSGHTFYNSLADAAAETNAISSGNAVSSLTDSDSDGTYDIYVTYDLNTEKWLKDGVVIETENTYYIKPADNDNYYWYMMRSDGKDGYALRADAGNSLPAIVNRSNENRTTITSDPTTDVSKRSQWSFVGTPYNVKIVNRYYGSSGYLGVADDCVAGARFSVYDKNATGVLTSWEVMSGLASSPKLFFRPQGSYGGETPFLYFGWDGGATQTGMTIAAGGNQAYDFTYIATTEKEHPSTVHLTASNETPNVDNPVTLTAVATPADASVNTVNSLVIEQETSTNVWEAVVPTSTTTVSGVVTVTYTFTPTTTGDYCFRAHADIDGTDQYSTDDAAVGGDGSKLTITASEEDITAGSNNYTLVLVDKSGNTLYTQTNVSKTRIENANSISGHNGDPLNDDWRSPLVARYYYYNTAQGAANNDASDLFDWSSTATTPTVYVGYTINPDYDLDGSENRNVDGKTYLLKFADGESFYQEKSDGFEDTAKPGIYPYINGEGGLFVYGDDKLTEAKNGAASTRTRWVWYLEGGDPYRLKISSLQTNTDGQNHYSYLRTYKPQGYSSVVTGAIPDNADIHDDSDDSHNSRHVPTEYMVLYGSTTSYMKLVTTAEITEGSVNAVTSLGKHQTVNSFENHWKNNPTAARLIAANDNTFTVGDTPTTEQKTAALVNGQGWHTYNTWAYASSWTSSSKTFDYAEHWYKTVNVGTEVTTGVFNGDFTLEEEEVEGVLVLLDQHGWEVMRKPITSTGNSKKTAYDADIKVYDSPMVKQYHFWTNFSKASGYHKYVPTRNAAKASNNATHRGSGTSLADYPEITSNGTLTDIYVTYEVNDEYRNSYVGAATKAATSASQFLIRQGTQYAKDADGTLAGDTEDNATAWKLHPNFDIDAEMDYQYEDGDYGELTKDETEAAYLANTSEEAVYDKTYGQNGFDPYNLQIESVTSGKFFTTNATSAANDGSGGIASTYGGTMTVTLANLNTTGTAMTDYWDIGTAYSIPKVTNQTFMAVQDANGNMRLMPRFDHSHVIEGFTVLNTQAAAQSANDESHSQTTLLTTGTITYHIVDNDGGDVFGAQTYTGAGFDIGAAFKSPMVAEYYFHSSIGDATDNRDHSTKTSFAGGDEVWISYKPIDDFSTTAWAIWANNTYMHLTYNFNGTNNQYRYTVQNQHYDLINVPGSAPFSHHTLTAADYALLDNHYMWNLGDDPYKVNLQNRATGYYVNINTSNPATSSAAWGETSSNSYSILYWTDKDGNTDTDYCSIFYRGSSLSTPQFVLSTTNSDYDWRADVRTANNYKDSDGINSKFYIKALPEVTVNVINNQSGEVDVKLQSYYNPDATMQTFVPYSMLRAYTSAHTLYYAYDSETMTASNAVNIGGRTPLDATTLGANGSNLYLTYDIDAAKWETVVKDANTSYIDAVRFNDGIANWYGLRYNGNNDSYLKVTSESMASALTRLTGPSSFTGTNEDATEGQQAQWAFIGTPYNLQIANRSFGINNSVLAIDANTPTSAQVYASTATDVIKTWEVVSWLNSGTQKLFIRPQGSFNGQNPLRYLSGAGGLSATAGGGEAFDVYWVKEETIEPDVTIGITTDPAAIAPDYATVNVDETCTLTATATPGTEKNVTYAVWEMETSDDVWEVVGTAYAGSDVAGKAVKADGTGIVTLTYAFTPESAGTYNFRVRAVVDDHDDIPTLSTYAVRLGGIGRKTYVTANAVEIDVADGTYTLKLVDKSNNILFTEDVTAETIEAENSISHRTGDPLRNSWRSPLVRRYFYYTTQQDASINSGSNRVNWNTITPGSTIYVGYDTNTDIDLNSSSFNNLSDLMNTRVKRGNGDNTQVRDADSFGTMYLLKFKMSADYNLEDGKDNRNEVATPDGSFVYPYTNGDGPIYIYSDQRYQSQINDGASTRTRWPWYLVSPDNDPYHVYITSWQSSHAEDKKNYYSYLRTYYQTGVGVVTNNITDDDERTLDGINEQIMPTDYMVLYGSGTDGLGYKLWTAGTIDDGSTTERRAVTSIEQYWRTNPTAQRYLGVEAGSGNLTTAQEEVLEGLGWHKYPHYAKANPAAGGSKVYDNPDHWFMTVELGDGSFDLVPTNINGVLVLLDQHGWEIMRHTIVEHDDPEYASVQASLKKYDSPMVSQYRFYNARNVNHKVPGYHKYNVLYGYGTKLTSQLEPDKVITSLADYPEKMTGGALEDLYVIYDVKENYASTYTPDPSAQAVGTASNFMVRQGSLYAKANGATVTTANAADWTDDNMLWQLAPNFNIDTEMGYQYDINAAGKNEETYVTQATTNADYYANGQAGFDPYNIQLKNVATGTFMTTNANGGQLSGGGMTATYPNGTSALRLAAPSTAYTPTWHDNNTINVTNQTFMIVDDGNGNMRLMPRFDCDHVVQAFATLETQAEAQPADDESHAQTTLFTTGATTFHIIDMSDAKVFGNDGILIDDNVGYTLPREYKSPFVKTYYYHTTEEHATDADTRYVSDATSASGTIYVTYEVDTEKFNPDIAWCIWNHNDYFMHANYRYKQHQEQNGAYFWWQAEQEHDRDGGHSISAATLPFLDNTFAWTAVGSTPDPYNVQFYNKGARRYIATQNSNGNHYRMDHLTTDVNNASHYSILYYDDDETNEYTTWLNRDLNRYVYMQESTTTGANWESDLIRGDNQAVNHVATNNQIGFHALPQIEINILDANDKVECTLEGYYNSGCSWDNSYTPFFLERIYTSGHTFYYDPGHTEEITGSTLNDAQVINNAAVYVKYTLASDWGTLDTTPNTLKVKPSPDSNKKIQWYGIRAMSDDGKFFTMNNNSIADAKLAGTNKATATDATSEADNVRRSQWAFIGTPYNLKLVERYHGLNSCLGIPEDANVANRIDAKIYKKNTEGIITTWEVCTGLGTNTNNNGVNNGKLLIRPQKSLNGEAPYTYVGFSGGGWGMEATTNANISVDLTWVREGDANIATFKLYDKDGTTMGLADDEYIGVSEGDALIDLFTDTDLPRRYCDYTFYSDNTFTTEATAATNDAAQTYYVKWNYSADAPVFSTGSDATQYQYYDMLAVSHYQQASAAGVVSTGGNAPTVSSTTYQWAFVGDPYSLKIYNRAAGKYLTAADALAGTTVSVTGTASGTGEAEDWDLPLPSRSLESSQFIVRRKDATTLYWGGNSQGYGQSLKTLKHIIVPLTVYKSDGTTEVDAMEYSIDYPNTDEAIKSDMLTAGSNGNRIHRHGFCDYTYYSDYPVSTVIPADGVSIYGGTEQQRKAVYATYTVSDNWSKNFLMYLQRNDDRQFYSKIDNSATGNQTSHETTVDEILQAADTKTYQWTFDGDPYSFKIVNADMSDTQYLGANALGNAAGTVKVTNDEETYKYNTFEIVETTTEPDSEGNGQYHFYLRYDGRDRYNDGILFYNYSNALMSVQSGLVSEISLRIAADQWNITWKVVDDDKNIVATSVMANVINGTLVTLGDMPDELKRHFCEYDFLYTGSDNGTTATYTDPDDNITETGITVTADGTLYVPYTLDSGAPNFVTAVPDDEANDYWYEIHYTDENDYLYTNGTTVTYSCAAVAGNEIETIREGANYSKYRWALIGTPYSVKFYNMEEDKYLTTDGTPGNATLTAEGTVFELLTDRYGEFCNIHDAVTNTYINQRGITQNNISDWLMAEFTNSNGLVKLTLVLHYSDETLRYDWTNSESMAGSKELITIDTYQKKGKPLTDVLPDEWKRAFCNYSFYWNKDLTTSSTDFESNDNEVTFITYEGDGNMLDWYNTGYEAQTGNNPDVSTIAVHVTYDYKTDSPFRWSDATVNGNNKYWYYFVNHHVQSPSKGKMLFTDGENSFRQTADMVDDMFYTNNYEWCVVGDPYGFKMLCYYDPDQKYNEYVRVSDDTHGTLTSKKLVNRDVDGLLSDQTLFEMRKSHSNWSKYFWMHPIYTSTLMDESNEYGGFSFVRADGLSSSHLILDEDVMSTSIQSTSIANFTLMPLTAPEMEEYLYYYGFVNGLSADVVDNDETTFDCGADGNLTLKEIYDKVKTLRAGVTDYSSYTHYITEEVADYIHEKLFSTGGQVLMKEGYYRIVPYVYERYEQESGEDGGRHYVRGYLYGNGTDGYTNSGATSTGYTDRQEYQDGATRTLMLNETMDKAAYDPASIFHFEATAVDGHPRYTVSTQGMWLSGEDGSAKLYDDEGDAHNCRVENIGSVITQLRVADSNNDGYNYLSYVQNWLGHEPVDARRAALRASFTAYNFTRFYLQPVGPEEDNLLPLRLEMHPGTYTPEGQTERQNFYFASLYVPYDVVLPADKNVYAYAGILTKDRDADTGMAAENHDWRLECHKLSAREVNGYAYEAGKFIPAGTPVLIRADATDGTDGVISETVSDYDRDHANSTANFTTLYLDTDAPATGLTPDATFFLGQYLEQELPASVLGENEAVYIFGQSTGQDYSTKTTADNAGTVDEAGFYVNKNAEDGSATYSKKNNRYVRHNKIYLIEKDARTRYIEHVADPSPAPAFIPIWFGETGIGDDGVPGAAMMYPDGVYDLNGRQLLTPEMMQEEGWRKRLSKGVYIINGKKVVIR